MDGEVATPRYLLNTNEEVPQSVMMLLGAGVVGGDFEAILAGADVAEDVVVEGSRACYRSMGHGMLQLGWRRAGSQ
jgi:hypothetical protein